MTNCLLPCRCESGDLSGKHGRLSIASDGPSRRMFTYVDSNLALTGMFSGKYECNHLKTKEHPTIELEL